MSSTTSKAAPFLGTWVFAGAASGLLFGIPLALLFFQHPLVLFVCIAVTIAALLLVGRRRRRPLAAFLASFVVAGALACVVASLLWFFSMAGQIG